MGVRRLKVAFPGVFPPAFAPAGINRIGHGEGHLATDERGGHGYRPRHISTLPESDIPGRVANSDNAAIVAVPVILVSF